MEKREGMKKSIAIYTLIVIANIATSLKPLSLWDKVQPVKETAKRIKIQTIYYWNCLTKPLEYNCSREDEDIFIEPILEKYNNLRSAANLPKAED